MPSRVLLALRSLLRGGIGGDPRLGFGGVLVYGGVVDLANTDSNRLRPAMVAGLAAEAVIIVASGVLASTPVVSTIIAGVFLVLNSVATLLIGAYLADRGKPQRKRKPKRRARD